MNHNKHSCEDEIAQARGEIARIEARIKEIEKREKGGWVPEYNEVYYLPNILNSGMKYCSQIRNGVVDNIMISRNLHCQIPEKAIYMSEYFFRIAPLLNKVYDLQGDWKPKARDERYYIVYFKNEFDIFKYHSALDLNPSFKSEALARQAIDELGEETLKKVFGITE